MTRRCWKLTVKYWEEPLLLCKQHGNEIQEWFGCDVSSTCPHCDQHNNFNYKVAKLQIEIHRKYGIIHDFIPGHKKQILQQQK